MNQIQIKKIIQSFQNQEVVYIRTIFLTNFFQKNSSFLH